MRRLRSSSGPSSHDEFHLPRAVPVVTAKYVHSPERHGTGQVCHRTTTADHSFACILDCPAASTSDSDREAVDSMCRDMTAPWVRRKAAGGDAGVNTCTFYEEYQERGTDAVIPSGIYSLDDLKDLGNLVSFFRGNK
jgi:hypothetical protein